MLRTLILAPVALFVLGAPSLAAAETFPEAVLHTEIVSDTGVVVGHVDSIDRDSQGNIVAIESAEAEPADAPAGALMVRRDPGPRVPDSHARVAENDHQNGAASQTLAR